MRGRDLACDKKKLRKWVMDWATMKSRVPPTSTSPASKYTHSYSPTSGRLWQFYYLSPGVPNSINVASPKPHLLLDSTCLTANGLPFPSLFTSEVFIKFHGSLLEKCCEETVHATKSNFKITRLLLVYLKYHEENTSLETYNSFLKSPFSPIHCAPILQMVPFISFNPSLQFQSASLPHTSCNPLFPSPPDSPLERPRTGMERRTLLNDGEDDQWEFSSLNRCISSQ